MFKLLNFVRPRTAEPSTPAAVEAARVRTLKLSIWEGSLWSVMSGFGDSFIQPFAVFLKAGNQAIALLGTLPPMMNALAQMAGASAVDRLGRRREFITAMIILQALSYALLFLVARLWASPLVPAAVVGCVALGAFFGGLCNPGWTSMMGDLVPPESRGAYFGRRSRYCLIAMFASSTAAGLLMSFMKREGWPWLGFGILFMVAMAARMSTAVLMDRHYDPPYAPRREDYFSFWAFLRRGPRSNFARFSFYCALMMGAVNISGPFFPLYMLRDLGWSYGQYTASNVTALVFHVVFVRWWGRVGDRHGYRTVFVTLSWLLPLMPLMWTLTNNFWLLLINQVLAGMVWSGWGIAVQNFTLDACTPPKRARASAYFSVMSGVVILLCGQLGGWLATRLPATYDLGFAQVRFLSSLPGLFILSSVCRAVIAVLLLPHIHEVRKQAAPVPAGRLLVLLATGEALRTELAPLGNWLAAPLRRWRENETRRP